jgi:hypothetical protein
MDQGHFTPINFTSATLSDFGGIHTGHKRHYYNYQFNCWQQYVLVFNNVGGTTLIDGVLCKLDTTAQTAGRNGVCKVLRGTSGGHAYCVNNTGATITDQYYFWGLQRGIGYGLAGGSIVATGLPLMAGATGFVALSTAGTDAIVGMAITAIAASTANTIDWMLPAGGLGA